MIVKIAFKRTLTLWVGFQHVAMVTVEQTPRDRMLRDMYEEV